VSSEILPLQILWADDQPDVIEALEGCLGDLPREVTRVLDGDAAFTALAKSAFDLVIVDLQMPPGTWGGLNLLRRLDARAREIPIVVVSGVGTLRECIEARRLGARDYVEKESAQEELGVVVMRVLEERAAERPLSDYDCVRRIERSLHGLVIKVLQREAERRGQPDIFRSAAPRKQASIVPQEIALKTYGRLIDGGGEQHQYLDLIDFKQIINAGWNEISDLRMLERVVKPRNKDDRTKWIVDLNEIRKVVAHPMRGDLSEEQRATLREIERIVNAWEKTLAEGR